MILQSITIMTLFDIFIISVTFVAIFFYIKHFRSLNELKFVGAVGYLIAGIAVLCATYVLDFLSMHVFPFSMSIELSDRIMNDLYTDWSWWITAVGVGLIVFGVAYLSRNLIPHTKTLLDELKSQNKELQCALEAQQQLEKHLRNLRNRLEQKNISKSVELTRMTRQLEAEKTERERLQNELTNNHSKQKTA